MKFMKFYFATVSILAAFFFVFLWAWLLLPIFLPEVYAQYAEVIKAGAGAFGVSCAGALGFAYMLK